MNFNHATSLLAKTLLITLVLSLLSACGGAGGAAGPTAAISSQPTDQSVVVDTTATFTVVATDATGYQWQSSTDGGTTFANVSGATATSYVTAATILDDDGTRYRVVVSDASNSVTSSAVTLTVTAAPVAPSISVQPAGQTVIEGQNASFSITAAGTSLGYQWQRSTDGGASFADVTGETGATLTLTAVPLANDTHQFRVVVSNSAGSVTSNAASLSVNPAQASPTFSTQPSSQSVIAPDTATFNVVVTGMPMPTLQWQLSTNAGSSFADIAGATGSSYTTAATGAGDNGNQYRVIATNTAGTINSNAATLTVAEPSIPNFTSQPADVTITEGQNAQFTVAVAGTPTPTLQWQLSTDGGSNWSNINGATNAALDLIGVALANNGRQFRVVASNSEGTVNSNAATLTVNAASSTNAILVSATSTGVVSNAPSHTASISTDGRWVAFATDSSTASNLVADGFGGGAFLHDMSTRSTTRINVRPDGGYSSQSVVSHLKLAADGQHALFTAYANDLVGGDTNNVLDVFVRNLQTGVTTRENVLPDGSQDNVSGNAGHPFPPDISADGRWVLMWSTVNLAGAGAGDYVGSGLFLRDRQTGVTRSVVPIGTGLFGAALSASGQYVVSVTTSSAPYTYHLDVYNVAQSTSTRLLSVPDDNGLGAIHGGVSVSDDGRFVACSVRSPTLVGGAAATNYQTVVLDRSLADPVAGMELVSVTDAAVAGSGGSSTRPQLSGDGRYVLFASRATNLAVEPFYDTLLVRDRQVGTTRVASRRIDGTPASGGIGMGSEALTRDGAIVVFMGDMWKIVDPTGNSGTGWQIFRVGRP